MDLHPPVEPGTVEPSVSPDAGGGGDRVPTRPLTRLGPPRPDGSRLAPVPTRDPALGDPVADEVGWSALDVRAVDTVRVLAADAVQRAGNGHPGTAMSLAPVAYLLFQDVLAPRPGRRQWLGRDRFVLSCGHTSLTLYLQLYLTGYGLELDDLRALRTWGSRTPGHPEYHHTRGVEITTGPLGPGAGQSRSAWPWRPVASGGCSTPTAPPGTSPFDHHVYVLASDGDLMEGVTAEASSLAGHQQLGNLVVVYDQNRISIEDDTGDRVQRGRRPPGTRLRLAHPGRRLDRDRRYIEDVDALHAALGRGPGRARSTVDRRPAHHHRMAGADTSRTPVGPTVRPWATTRWPPSSASSDSPDDQTFVRRARRAAARTRRGRSGGGRLHDEWQPAYDAWRPPHPGRARAAGPPAVAPAPGRVEAALPEFDADPTGWPPGRRPAGVLDALAPVLPELWGGSADLAGSNDTTMDGEPSFVPAERQTARWPGGPYGRTLHFGVREHAMGADPERDRPVESHPTLRRDLPRLQRLHAASRPTGRPDAAARATFVWTHDSIGLGEDGPTHQPVEHLAALRAIPGLDVVRPADANETAVCWRTILEHGGPAGRARALPTGGPRPGPGGRWPAAPAGRCGPGRLRPGRGTGRVASPRSCSWPPAPRCHLALDARPCPRRPGRRRPGWCPCRAWSGSPARTPSTADAGAAPGRAGPCQHRGRHRPGLAGLRRRRRPAREPRTVRCFGRWTQGVRRARLHHRSRRARGPREHGRRPGSDPARRLAVRCGAAGRRDR